MGFLSEGAPEGAADWVSLIQGTVDTVQIDFPAHLARLHGRDLTAALISSPTQETFANRTASEIATILAQRHNLTPQVTATTTLVDRYYELEHDRITLNQFSRASTEWDLLVALAQQEAFEVFVEGTSLYFQPARTHISTPDAILRPAATMNGPANVMELRMERALALAGETTVTVKSWNSRQKQAYVQTVRSPGDGSGGASQNYVVVRPNLLPDQVATLAQNWLAALTQHERVVTALMPGELSLTPRSVIAIEGTGTAFDQMYYVDSIERRVAIRGGFVQHLRAKNATVAGAAGAAGVG